jgi:hypothetical protein
VILFTLLVSICAAAPAVPPADPPPAIVTEQYDPLWRLRRVAEGR